MKRLSCEIQGQVNNSAPNIPAELSLNCKNLETLCAMGLPPTAINFLLKNYVTTCKQLELPVEGGAVTKRFCYELVQERKASTTSTARDEGGRDEDEEKVDFEMRGYFENMGSKVIYDPAVVMEMDTIGMVELELMKSYYKSATSSNTEESLKKDQEAMARVVKPLHVHFTTDVMVTECKFIVLLREAIFVLCELLKFGGADFLNVRSVDDDEKMMTDLR